jgi:hypothetical protein
MDGLHTLINIGNFSYVEWYYCLLAIWKERYHFRVTTFPSPNARRLRPEPDRPTALPNHSILHLINLTVSHNRDCLTVPFSFSRQCIPLLPSVVVFALLNSWFVLTLYSSSQFVVAFCQFLACT